MSFSFVLLGFLSSAKDKRAAHFSPDCAEDKPEQLEFLCQDAGAWDFSSQQCLPGAVLWTWNAGHKESGGKVSIKSNGDKKP